MVLLLACKVVSTPRSRWLHSRTSADMTEVCRQADIIVACAGRARMITAAHVKLGAAVVDVGVIAQRAGIVGDVDFDVPWQRGKTGRPGMPCTRGR
ncbi:MAG: hypothetical protein R2713_24015 [Ilumatobacteraceae bacterium]